MGKQKFNIPMCAALVLLLLTMVTTHFTSGLYARYTTTASAADSARVAAFNVTCDVAAVTDTKDQFTVTVTNSSEVTVSYSIEIHTAKLSATLGTETKNPTDGVICFEFADPLAPGADAKHTLEMAVIDWTGLTGDAESANGTETVDVELDIRVVATQVD